MSEIHHNLTHLLLALIIVFLGVEYDDPVTMWGGVVIGALSAITITLAAIERLRREWRRR